MANEQVTQRAPRSKPVDAADFAKVAIAGLKAGESNATMAKKLGMKVPTFSVRLSQARSDYPDAFKELPARTRSSRNLSEVFSNARKELDAADAAPADAAG